MKYLNHIHVTAIFAIVTCLLASSLKAQIHQQDSLTLVNLYNGTNGSNWKNNTNWLTAAPASSWYGVSLSNGRVSSLSLSNNNLTGSVPVLTSNLTQLVYLNLDSNQLNFNGLETVALMPVTTNIYAPQNSIPLSKSGYLLSFSVGGTPQNNTYNWYRNGILDKTTVGDSTYTVTCPGNYYATATNSFATKLTLSSDTVFYSVSLFAPTITIATPADSICAGASASFVATITNGGSNPSYQWQKNGKPVGTNNDIYTDTTLANNDTISCLLTNSLVAACGLPNAVSNNIIIHRRAGNNTSSATSFTFCAGSGFIFNGNKYDSAGTYTVHLTNNAGCDSVVKLVLTVRYPSYDTTIYNNVCDGFTFNWCGHLCENYNFDWNGMIITQPGIYSAHLTSSFGCDSSTTILIQTFNHNTASATLDTICEGNFVLFNGVKYDSTGVYQVQLSNSTGCDSTAFLVLTVGQKTSSVDTVTICQGGFYIFNDTIYNTAGVYSVHLINSLGCDSTATLVLFVDKCLVAITGVTPQTATSGDTVTIHGHYFTAATAVMFGGVNAASFVVVNDSTIIAVVGNGASGNVEVYVPNVNNAWASYAGFTYAGALPVEIANLSAEYLGEDVFVKWRTVTELNTNHFIIQHSRDGNSFTDIGVVKAIGSGANKYSFTDNNPANGINYYRLESVDKAGAVSFSKEVSCEWLVVSKQLVVYPNPAKENVTIKGSHISSVQVMDNFGRVVKVVSFKDATNPTLSVNGLPTGVYHLRMQSTDGGLSAVGVVISDK